MLLPLRTASFGLWYILLDDVDPIHNISGTCILERWSGFWPQVFDYMKS